MVTVWWSLKSAPNNVATDHVRAVFGCEDGRRHPVGQGPMVLDDIVLGAKHGREPVAPPLGQVCELEFTA